MIGQGAICAQSKEDALDWLKIIKTAFILVDTNKQDLDYNNFKSNFKFEDIEEFGSSSSYESTSSRHSNYESNRSQSSIFADLDNSIFESGEADEETPFDSHLMMNLFTMRDLREIPIQKKY